MVEVSRPYSIIFMILSNTRYSICGDWTAVVSELYLTRMDPH
jgi:hypothetical protein